MAELEAKLTKLATQLEAKPTPKPAETKPAATAKPKGTLPKGMGEKPAEAPKPKEAPKPAENNSITASSNSAGSIGRCILQCQND